MKQAARPQISAQSRMSPWCSGEACGPPMCRQWCEHWLHIEAHSPQTFMQASISLEGIWWDMMRTFLVGVQMNAAPARAGAVYWLSIARIRATSRDWSSIIFRAMPRRSSRRRLGMEDLAMPIPCS